MTTKKQIALLIYPGLTAFDLLGPLQVLAELPRHAPEYEVHVVGETGDAVETDLRTQLIPDMAFADMPAPYAFIIPGGGHPTLAQMYHPPMRDYVRQIAGSATLIGSVCTGSLILGSVGLLRGRRATTHWGYVQALERLGATYVRERWVQDGNIVTGAGISAGIDYGLYLVGQLVGEDIARRIQLSIEYDPQPPHAKIDYNRPSFTLRAVNLVARAMSSSAVKKVHQLEARGL